MKNFVLVFTVFFSCINSLYGQEKLTVALVIQKPPVHTSQGWIIVVSKPEGVDIKDGQVFVCKGVYQNNLTDTAARGIGHAQKVYTDYVESIIKDSNVKIIPKEGDLCFFILNGYVDRKDVFFKLARFAISFSSATDSLIFEAEKALDKWNDNKTNNISALLVEDILYTGKAMAAQNDGQQQMITEGDFKGLLLFTAMQGITAANLFDFLNYAWARPTKYAGKTWHISEVFATWMISGTPKLVIK